MLMSSLTTGLSCCFAAGCASCAAAVNGQSTPNATAAILRATRDVLSPPRLRFPTALLITLLKPLLSRRTHPARSCSHVPLLSRHAPSLERVEDSLNHGGGRPLQRHFLVVRADDGFHG